MCCKGPELSWYVNGAIQYILAPGTIYPNGNVIDAGGAKSELLNFNPSTLTYTVMLKSGAQAISAGTATGADRRHRRRHARRPTSWELMRTRY